VRANGRVIGVLIGGIACSVAGHVGGAVGFIAAVIASVGAVVFMHCSGNEPRRPTDARRPYIDPPSSGHRWMP
jgi:phage tail tape-measure protein